MKLTFVKSMENENKKYELYTIGEYEVDVTIYDSGYKSIHVRAKDYSARYLPCIYCKDNFEGKVLGFEIQTTSYGALNTDEIKKVIEGYNKALEVVEVLTKEFVK